MNDSQSRSERIRLGGRGRSRSVAQEVAVPRVRRRRSSSRCCSRSSSAQFVVQAFTIPSGSMMDTLLIGDYILVNKFLLGPEIPFTD